MESARQSAIGTGLDLFAFMTALPDAFLASEQRELKRLSRTAEKKNDPRIGRLKVSIERAEELRANAMLGKARVERMLGSLSEDVNVFHGFVSDSDLQPREKLTVRITADRDGEKTEKSLSASTDADGYFSIPLGKAENARHKSAAPESAVNLSDRMNELLKRVNAKPASSSAAAYVDGSEVLARVEVLDAAGNILHQDVSPLVVNDGTAYREYIVDGNQPAVYDTKKGSKVAPDEAKPATVARKAGETEKPAATAPSKKKPATATRKVVSKSAPPNKKTIDKKTKK